MKTFTRHLFLLLALLPFFVSANVYVHGRVKNNNGLGMPGMAVTIVGDSALAIPSTCYQRHIVLTDSLGFYRDTLICNTNMTTVSVWMINCNGTALRKNYTLTANQNVESNFTFCEPSIIQCNSLFIWQTSGLNVQFFSGGSSPFNPLTDSIVSRTWTFGDGTSLNGNVINPAHQYARDGLYTVCLKIRTQTGCENIICRSVPLGNYTCVANFIWERIAGTNRIKFNSTSSTAIASDSIISRKWKFGDGDSLIGNIVSPEHTYAQPGTYNACLTIRTAAGCEKTVCRVVFLQNTSVTCNANFISTSFGSNYLFEGGYSTVASGDSILSRQWDFGDGFTGSGLWPLHNYISPGSYTVCLTIQTMSGCTDSACKRVTVLTPASPHCEAVFTAENTTPPAGSNTALRYVRFNGAASHGATAADSIISCIWNFGDSSSITIANTQTSPLHGYVPGGTYNACLYILTQSGCRDTICRTIVLPAIVPNCEPRFVTTATALSVVFNGSGSSAAASDSIVSRTWAFGDGTGVANAAVVTHQYPLAGAYVACLTIRTRLGCVKTLCKSVTVITVPGNCVPFFTKEQTAAQRTMRFNSTASYSQLPNDSIIRRKWEFGDGQTLDGNVVSPLHTYITGGTYNVCLTIYTQRCEKRWCQTIQVLPLQTAMGDSLNIVNLYPIPVNTQLNAVIYSGRPNITAELAIYDVYGVRKWYQMVVLPFGNSTYNVPTAALATGPYIFKVTTQYGVRSRSFYKVN